VRKTDSAYVRELLDEIQKGDGNAFAALYGMTCQKQYRYAWSRLGDIYRTQDAVTETYIRFMQEERPDGVRLERWLTDLNRSVCGRMLRSSGGLPSRGEKAEKEEKKEEEKTAEALVLDSDIAEQMLYNILDALEMPRNTVPLEHLEEYSGYRMQKTRLWKTVVLVLLALLFLIPLALVRPEMTLEKTENRDQSGRPVYTVTVSSLLDIYSVTAEVGGVQMPVYQEGASVYTVRPTKNGRMSVTVKAENGRWVRDYVKVDTKDTEPPVLVSRTIRDDGRAVYVFSDENRIRFDRIYEEERDGTIHRPVSCNTETGEVVFAVPEADAVIYVQDATGNTLRLVVHPAEAS
jgi:DNA-directed RNA polymerase specialized sigma24 family protein